MYHPYRNDSPLSYTSITPTGTPELSGLSPAPRPKLRIPSGSFHYDENTAPQPHVSLHATPLQSIHTPSTGGGSTSSRTTFWSAVGSVDIEEAYEPAVDKADSGILVSPILPPSPGGSGSGSGSGSGRGSSSSSSTTPSNKTRKYHPKSPSSSSSRETPQPRHPSRQSTSTSTWTSSSSSTAIPQKLSRASTEATLRSPPRALTKPSRTDIAVSLQQKYPNDRCHGAFLPFRSEFSHSKDSLCPVRFVGAPDGVEKQVPATPASEAYNGPVMYNTPIDWKGDEARRREYEAADKQRSGWRRWCCGLFGGRKDKVFWDGDDGGSVRRYRLALPEREEEKEGRMVGMKIEARERDGWENGMVMI